jgi:ACR3 family arsenite transporter
LFTIVAMFSPRANIVELPLDVVRIAVPLLISYHHVPVQLLMSQKASATYRRRQHPFTAASNNFGLAIAVAGGVYNLIGQAFAAVIRPAGAVPVMIGLVNVASAENACIRLHCDNPCKS